MRDNLKDQITGLEETKLTEDSKPLGREDSLRGAIEATIAVREHLSVLKARFNGMESEPYPEEVMPNSLAELLTQQPEMIIRLCECLHDDLLDLETNLFD